MTEIVLLLVIVALCSLVAWLDWNNRKERKSLVNALVAKDAQELANLELAEKTKIELEKEPVPDLTPLSSLGDEDFIKAIKNEKNEGGEDNA